jgi:N-acetylmuramic acid 6-phosphate etherase
MSGFANPNPLLMNINQPMLHNLTTEGRNPASESIDCLTALEIVDLINREDATVAASVATQKAEIAQAVEAVARQLHRGGRLIYVGAGTSGRLGVLDASECPPTFNADPSQVVALIAGGPSAVFQAVEGAEDSPELAVEDLKSISLSAEDVLIGIATSGRTPYVLGAMKYARLLGAFTVGFACNKDAELTQCADLSIIPVVGPEVISGSTRMKAGTATKMVLNTITTGAMVLLGKTYGNLMVDLNSMNTKLAARTVRIVSDLTNLPEAEAQALLDQCDGELKTAVVSQLRGRSPAEARALLQETGRRLRIAIETEHE